MASISLSHITDLTALKIGEFPDCRLPPTPGAEQTTLSAMLEVRIEEAARHLTRTLPLSHFSAPADLRPAFAAASTASSGSYAELTLPADFCRLTGLRLPGWGTSLNEDFPGDPLRAALCENAPAWLIARQGRPWLRLIKGGSRTLLRFGPPAASIPVEAAYIPLPRYDPVSRLLDNFDPALLSPLIEILSENPVEI